MVRKMSFKLASIAGALAKTGNGKTTSPGGKSAGEAHSVDQALELSGFGRYNAGMLAYCGSLMLGMILETLGLSYVLPSARCDLQLSESTRGWLAAVPFAGFVLTSHAWGWGADRYGRKRALALSTGAGAAASLLSSLAPELYSFIALRFATSLFVAGGAALGYTFLGEFSPPAHRDKMIALANASVALGTAVVPLVAWAVLPADFTWTLVGLPYRPWRLLVCCYAAPYFLCALTSKFLRESPKYLATRGREQKALKVLQAVHACNTGLPSERYPVTKVSAESGAGRSGALVTMFGMGYLKYSALLCFLQFVSFAVSNGFYMWLPGVVDRVWGSEPVSGATNLCGLLNVAPREESASEETCNATLRTEAFAVTSGVMTAVTIFTVLVASLVRVVGKKLILSTLFLTAGACAMALHWTAHPPAAVLLFCAFQLCSTTIGLVNAFVVQIYPTHYRATAVCVAMVAGRVGSMLFSKLIPTLLVQNCPLCFFLTAGLLLGSGVLTLLLPGTQTAGTQTPGILRPVSSTSA